ALGTASGDIGRSSNAGSELAPATTTVTARMTPLQNRLSIMPPIDSRPAASLRRLCAGVEALPGRGLPYGQPRSTPSLKNTRYGVVPVALPSFARQRPLVHSVPPCAGTASNSTLL